MSHPAPCLGPDYCRWFSIGMITLLTWTNSMGQLPASPDGKPVVLTLDDGRSFGERSPWQPSSNRTKQLLTIACALNSL